MGPAPQPAPSATEPSEALEFTALFERELSYVWNTLRRLGNSAKLDGDPPPDTAQVLAPVVIQEHQAMDLDFDSDRLFWTADARAAPGKLRSCKPGGCTTTLRDHATEVEGFFASSGRLVWFAKLNLFSCLGTDCGSAETVIRGTQIWLLPSVDASRVCWAEDSEQVYCCPHGGCGAVPEVALTGSVTGIALHDNALFYTKQGHQHWELRRVDRETAIDTLILEHEQQFQIKTFAHGEVFFAEQGRPPYACQLPSCERPRSLVSSSYQAQGLTTRVRADDHHVYWVEANDGAAGRLLRCSLAGCTAPEELLPQAHVFSFALGPDAIYLLQPTIVDRTRDFVADFAIRQLPK